MRHSIESMRTSASKDHKESTSTESAADELSMDTLRGTQTLENFETSIREMTPPVLSLAVQLHPERNGNSPRKLELSVENAVKDLDLPASLTTRALTALHQLPSARTVLLFVNEDECKAVPLAVDLPVTNKTNGEARARYGEPDMVPLQVAKQLGRHAAAVVHQDVVALYGLLPTGAKTIKVFSRDAAPGAGNSLEASKQVAPAYTASRGGSAHDDVAEHRAEWIKKFYTSVASEIASLMKAHKLVSLTLVGTDSESGHFQELLPDSVAKKVLGRSTLDSDEQNPSSLQDSCEPFISAHETQRQADLLGSLRADGLHGQPACEEALSLGRVETLIVPWNETLGTCEVPNELIDKASASGAKVAFVTGDARDALRQDHHGVAGITRW